MDKYIERASSFANDGASPAGDDNEIGQRRKSRTIMDRVIPTTMASQHPDHARCPYWHSEPFIKTQDETLECFLSFSELGIPEYKWDWEGKLVDESVIERLFSQYFEYFQKNPLGKEKFLTFRLPNPKVETEFRLGRAFMGILSAAGLAKQVGLHNPPLFEVILPMAESAAEMLAIHDAFNEMASLKHYLHNFGKGELKHIEVIPLFEQIDIIINSHRILEEYLESHRWRFGAVPSYMRPYLARSDPALNSGLVPTVLAIKIALSHYKDFEEKHSIPLYPILGSASLPFRGGLTPYNVKPFAAEYAGVRTVLLQSAFRYDFDKTNVIDAVRELNAILPQSQAVKVAFSEEQSLLEVIPYFESCYRDAVEEASPLINKIASFLPKRRERVQHIGLFGYSRGVGKVKLPRAIGFTAALYSLGIPPELIGSGRGIKHCRESGRLELVEKFYTGLKADLSRAGRFLYRPGLEELAGSSLAWRGVSEDVKAIENYLGEELGPRTSEEQEHYRLVGEIHKELKNEKPLTELLTQAALLRRSLG